MFRITPYLFNYTKTLATYADVISETDARLLPLGFIKEDIGLSQDGGYMMHGYKYGDFTKPTIWIDANVHGSEWQCSYYCLDFFEKLATKDFYDKVAVTNLHDSFSFYYVPSLNPWGYDNVSYTNSRGVDLNRNFDSRWEQAPIDEGGMNYKGTAPFSEAESQNIRDKFLQIKPIVAINGHTTTGNASGIDMNDKYRQYQELSRDIIRSSEISIREAGLSRWNGQWNPSVQAWYGLQTSKEGTGTIVTILEHQSDTDLFNYGLTTLFIFCFQVLNYWQNGKLKMYSLAEIK